MENGENVRLNILVVKEKCRKGVDCVGGLSRRRRRNEQRKL